MHRLGLFIGIDRYLRIEPPLECAAADAKAVARVFHDQLGFETEVLTHDDLGYSGRSASIYDILGPWEKRVKEQPGGLLVIFFAGHGTTSDTGEELLLLPTASTKVLESHKPGQGMLTRSELLADTGDWPGMGRVFIIDACRSPVGRTQRRQGEIGRRDPELVSTLTGAGEAEPAWLRSCANWEIAHELLNYDGKGSSHGLYSAALIEEIEAACRIGRPIIVDEDLNSRLAQRMRTLAQNARGEGKDDVLAQVPVRRGASIRLLGTEDRREIQIRRLLAEFEQQLSAGQLGQPPGYCCRDTLNRLIALNHERDATSNLSARLQAAEATQATAKQKERDDKLIAIARQLHTPDAYGHVLRDSENGEHKAEAEAFIRQHAEHADGVAWTETRPTNTVAGYRAYLARFPQGIHAKEANEAIARLELGQREVEEDRDWKTAQESLQGLIAFVGKWPQGRHRIDADKAITALEHQAALARDQKRLQEAQREKENAAREAEALKRRDAEREAAEKKQTERLEREKRDSELRAARERDQHRCELACETNTEVAYWKALKEFESDEYIEEIEGRLRALLAQLARQQTAEAEAAITKQRQKLADESQRRKELELKEPSAQNGKDQSTKSGIWNGTVAVLAIVFWVALFVYLIGKREAQNPPTIRSESTKEGPSVHAPGPAPVVPFTSGAEKARAWREQTLEIERSTWWNKANTLPSAEQRQWAKATETYAKSYQWPRAQFSLAALYCTGRATPQIEQSLRDCGQWFSLALMNPQLTPGEERDNMVQGVVQAFKHLVLDPAKTASADRIFAQALAPGLAALQAEYPGLGLRLAITLACFQEPVDRSAAQQTLKGIIEKHGGRPEASEAQRLLSAWQSGTVVCR